MFLGRVPSIPDKRTLDLSNYVDMVRLPLADELLPEAPAQEMLHTNNAHPWPVLTNDRLPCCTSSAAGHMVHYWTEVNGHLVLLTDDDIIQAHEALTGGRAGHSVYMLDALKYWRNTGIGNHSIHAFVQARPRSRDDLRSAIYLFGSAYVGLDLPDFAYPTPLPADLSTIPTIPWAIPTDLPPEACEPRPEKGHCVAAIGYDQQIVYVVTWGTLKTMSWEFYERYASESYAILSSDWATGAKPSPSGFDFAALQRDLDLIHGT